MSHHCSSSKNIVIADNLELIPGHPELNAPAIISRIHEEQVRGSSIIIFPDISVSGYEIDKEPRNEEFRDRCESWNDEIAHATIGITVIWGHTTPNESFKNSAFVASNGYLISLMI